MGSSRALSRPLLLGRPQVRWRADAHKLAPRKWAQTRRRQRSTTSEICCAGASSPSGQTTAELKQICPRGPINLSSRQRAVQFPILAARRRCWSRRERPSGRVARAKAIVSAGRAAPEFPPTHCWPADERARQGGRPAGQCRVSRGAGFRSRRQIQPLPRAPMGSNGLQSAPLGSIAPPAALARLPHLAAPPASADCRRSKSAARCQHARPSELGWPAPLGPASARGSAGMGALDTLMFVFSSSAASSASSASSAPSAATYAATAAH